MQGKEIRKNSNKAATTTRRDSLGIEASFIRNIFIDYAVFASVITGNMATLNIL